MARLAVYLSSFHAWSCPGLVSGIRRVEGDARGTTGTVETSPPASVASLLLLPCYIFYQRTNGPLYGRAGWYLSGTTLPHAAVPCLISLAQRLQLLAIPRRFVSALLLWLWNTLLLSDTFTCNMGHGIVKTHILAAVAIPSGPCRHACTTMCITLPCT